MPTTKVMGTVVPCERCGQKNRVRPASEGKPQCGNCHAPLPWVADATDSTFADIVERSVLPVIVDLWAPWCGPCRMVTPALEQLGREMAGEMKLVKVNVDDAPALSQRFEVRAVPTLLVMKGAQVVATQAGAAPVHVLRRWVQDALAKQDKGTANTQ